MDFEGIVVLIFAVALVGFLIYQAIPLIRAKKYLEFIGVLVVTVGFAIVAYSFIKSGFEGMGHGILGGMFIAAGLIWLLTLLIIQSIQQKRAAKELKK